jgi:hypothetical protein
LDAQIDPLSLSLLADSILVLSTFFHSKTECQLTKRVISTIDCNTPLCSGFFGQFVCELQGSLFFLAVQKLAVSTCQQTVRTARDWSGALELKWQKD